MSMGKRPTTALKMLDNKGVRNALIALTDKDFEFNQPQWKGWYVARTTPENLDLRRDP